MSSNKKDLGLEELIPVDDAELDKQGTLKSKLNLTKIAYLVAQGFTSEEIAREMNVCRETITKVRGSDEFKSALALLTSEAVTLARYFITSASMKAVRTMVECLNSGDDRVRLSAAKEILNRTGVKAPEDANANKGDNKLASMSNEELMNLIAMNVEEIKQGNVVEASYEEDKEE